jgi:hypothetical protein
VICKSAKLYEIREDGYLTYFFLIYGDMVILMVIEEFPECVPYGVSMLDADPENPYGKLMKYVDIENYEYFRSIEFSLWQE